MSDASEAVARQIVEATAKCGITTIASLPDGWITDLITAYARDNRFRHLAVNREEAAIGFCSGAYLGGLGAMALMGASGFLTCIYALTKITYTYQITNTGAVALNIVANDNRLGTVAALAGELAPAATRTARKSPAGCSPTNNDSRRRS